MRACRTELRLEDGLLRRDLLFDLLFERQGGRSQCALGEPLTLILQLALQAMKLTQVVGSQASYVTGGQRGFAVRAGSVLSEGDVWEDPPFFHVILGADRQWVFIEHIDQARKKRWHAPSPEGV